MPRKGTATVKKVSKYMTSSEEKEEEELSSVKASSERNPTPRKRSPVKRKVTFNTSDSENVDPAVTREQLKRPNEAQREPDNGAGQPRQDSIVQQSATLANSLFPEDVCPTNNDTPKTLITPKPRPRQKDRPSLEPRLRIRNSSIPHSRARNQESLAGRAANLNLSSPSKPTQQRQQSRSDPPTNDDGEVQWPDTMIQGGASIPSNMQRHMRACMVCSIVRTQQQFTTQGCPNCEEILELAGNPEQVNDCTSQVFEGLISVADTNRSWVARYQRLEGYVPGVYATQVEGILPEDILVAVENAGINYVPRDGSEQEMLGKD